MRRLVATLAPAALVAVLAAVPQGCGSGSRAPTAEPPPGYFGVNGVVLRAWSSQGRHALVERHLRQVSETGIEFVRAHIDWQRIQPLAPAPGRPSFDFAASDAWVEALARHRLRWYVFGLGNPTPAWAAIGGLPPACAHRSPPARPGDLARVMGAIAQRYGSDGSFWREHPKLPRLPARQYEVWNAPNHGGAWCPQPDPGAYARLYAATRAAVREADPRAEVLVGGLGAFSETRAPPRGAVEVEVGEFLKAMLAEDPSLAKTIDGIGAHVYRPTAREALDTIAWFRDRLGEVGLGEVPISWNEFGWPTAGGETGAVPETERASHLRRVALTDLSGCSVESLALHTWTTEERYESDPEEWFGIADPETAEPYPSARALGAAIGAAREGESLAGPCD